MKLNEYQEKIIKFDTSGVNEPLSVVNFAFLDKVLGLTGESGEVADKVKKLLRDKEGTISAADKAALSKELGDVLWYLATTARYLGLSLEEIAVENVAKLDSRLVRGKIAGNGDER